MAGPARPVWNYPSLRAKHSFDRPPPHPGAPALTPTSTCVGSAAPAAGNQRHTRPVGGRLACVRISGSVTDGDPRGGDGVIWVLRRGLHTLAAGTLRNGAGRKPFGVPSGGVNAGEMLYVKFAPRRSSGYDSTTFSLRIDRAAIAGGRADTTWCPIEPFPGSPGRVPRLAYRASHRRRPATRAPGRAAHRAAARAPIDRRPRSRLAQVARRRAGAGVRHAAWHGDAVGGRALAPRHAARRARPRGPPRRLERRRAPTSRRGPCHSVRRSRTATARSAC